jgi:hypothetical protein
MACFCSAVCPALMTTAAWVPAWASCSIRPTVAGGVQITASSGTAGRSATRA